jgi:uncharacterized paraquat-inducible protein A
MSGNGAVTIIVLGSIVVPLAGVAVLCWIFWRHRHDE